MIEITDKISCCGCGACAAACHQNAITMQADELGFKYPIVNKEKCNNCGICDTICAFKHNFRLIDKLDIPKAFAVRHKDIKEIEKSRSGAAFVAFSDYVLERDGVVYGAGFGENFKIIHKRATNKKQRDEFRGSKYVQSDLTTIYEAIKLDLKNGKTVLFSGTPCQTSSLNLFISKKLQERLLLIDIICHGVTSPQIWADYINYLTIKKHKKIVKVNFRDKSLFGWNAHKETFELSNGESYIDSYNYYHSNMYRMSCYNCPFCNVNRPSDITLGDFWGIEKINDSFNADNKGCSLVLCNSQKGLDFFSQSTKNLEFFEVPLQSCLQANLQYPTGMPNNRIQYEKDYYQKGFSYIKWKYGNTRIDMKLKSYIYKVLKKLGFSL